jgi:proteic killer suppression protein
MEIEFLTKKLERLLNSESSILRNYGDANGRKIMRRLEVLAASPSLAHVPRSKPERCHQLKRDRDEIFAVDIEHPYRLLFRPQDPIPRLSDGGIDLSAVKSIIIIGIEDYH